MTEYGLTLQITNPLPGMETLLQIIIDGLAKLGYSEDDYYAEVTGPPEFNIKVVRR